MTTIHVCLLPLTDGEHTCSCGRIFRDKVQVGGPPENPVCGLCGHSTVHYGGDFCGCTAIVLPPGHPGGAGRYCACICTDDPAVAAHADRWWRP